MSKPSVKLVKMTSKWKETIDWEGLVNQHLPQSVPDEKQLRNDNLLVVANLTDLRVCQGHFTPSRTWTKIMEDGLMRKGLNRYGMVRMLAMVPSEEAELLNPRTVLNRKKVAFLNESMALHLINVAEAGTNEAKVIQREWDLITKSAARTAQRTADANITIPQGRQRPPIPMAPETNNPGRIPVPYVPRPKVEMHQAYLDLKEDFERYANSTAHGSSSRRRRLSSLRKDLNTRLGQVNQDNRLWYERLQCADMQSAIDSQERALVQAVADPAGDPQEIRELDSRLASMRSKFTERLSKETYLVTNYLHTLTDNRRAALLTGNLDDSVLTWDRRPFEPLHIKDEDMWPDTRPCSILYFEPDVHSRLVRLLTSDSDGRPQPEKIELFVAVIAALGVRASDSLASILEKMFPGRPTVEVIKAVPSLFPYVPKKLRSDHSALASSSSSSSSTSSSSKSKESKTTATATTTPTPSLIDTFDYDLGSVRLRSLPISAITDLASEYIAWPGRPESALQVSRSLGGSLTAFSSGSAAFEYAAGKAAGKVKNL